MSKYCNCDNPTISKRDNIGDKHGVCMSCGCSPFIQFSKNSEDGEYTGEVVVGKRGYFIIITDGDVKHKLTQEKVRDYEFMMGEEGQSLADLIASKTTKITYSYNGKYGKSNIILDWANLPKTKEYRKNEQEREVKNEKIRNENKIAQKKRSETYKIEAEKAEKENEDYKKEEAKKEAEKAEKENEKKDQHEKNVEKFNKKMEEDKIIFFNIIKEKKMKSIGDQLLYSLPRSGNIAKTYIKIIPSRNNFEIAISAILKLSKQEIAEKLKSAGKGKSKAYNVYKIFA